MKEYEESTVENDLVDASAEMGVNNSQVATENVGHQEQSNQNEINWKQANEALSQMKLDKARVEGELQALRGYMNNSQQPQQQKPKQFFEGRERDDLPNIDDVENYVSNVVNSKTREFETTIEQLKLQAIDPKYKEVIGKYQEHLPLALKESILQSPTPWQTAYEAITNSAVYYRDQIASQQHPDAKRIMENSQKPKTLSGVSQASSLSEASRYEQMSDDEIIALGDRFSRGG